MWGTTGNPDSLVTQVSAWKDAVAPEVIAEAIEEFLIEAVQEMSDYIASRGLRDGVPNGDGRIATGAMLRSVDYILGTLGNSRVQANFGYLNNAPKWAIWQEYGTIGGQGNGRGIQEMLALTDAFATFEIKMVDAFNNGRIVRFKQGMYTN